MIDPYISPPADDYSTIDLGDDWSTVEALAAWRREGVGGKVIAVFAEPELAAVYADELGVTAVAWLPLLGQLVAAAMPPRPRAAVAPSPVVVGDGRVARCLVEALVEGWADPGQPLEVHCVGAEPGWAQEASSIVEPQGQLTWSELPTRAVPVVRRILELVAAWSPPARKNGDPTGPTVLVALESATESMSLANSVATAVQGARVGVVVPDATVWPAVDGVAVFDIAQARRAALDLHAAGSTRLSDQLLAEVAWLGAPDSMVTRPKTPIFAEAVYGSDFAPLPFTSQGRLLREQLRAVSAALPEIIRAGCLEPADRARRTEPVILTPAELQSMALEILRALGAEGAGVKDTAIELAYLLPAIASRAGLPLQRPTDYVPLLTYDDVERLAPLVHFAYQDVSAVTGNATASPLAGALWDQLTEFERAGNRAVLVGAAVAHAVLGLDWRSARDSTGLRMTDDQIERLAELEHRRWAVHQRRNGAGSHEWMKPWFGPKETRVSEGAKEYDRHIVRQTILILAGADVEVFVGS